MDQGRNRIVLSAFVEFLNTNWVAIASLARFCIPWVSAGGKGLHERSRGGSSGSIRQVPESDSDQPRAGVHSQSTLR
jgi:hypothetical protein